MDEGNYSHPWIHFPSSLSLLSTLKYLSFWKMNCVLNTIFKLRGAFFLRIKVGWKKVWTTALRKGVLQQRHEATPGEVLLLVELWCVSEVTLPQLCYTSLRLPIIAWGLLRHSYLKYFTCQRHRFVTGEKFLFFSPLVSGFCPCCYSPPSFFLSFSLPRSSWL